MLLLLLYYYIAYCILLYCNYYILKLLCYCYYYCATIITVQTLLIRYYHLVRLVAVIQQSGTAAKCSKPWYSQSLSWIYWSASWSAHESHRIVVLEAVKKSSYWKQSKIKFKHTKGCHQTRLPGYLDEFIWRERCCWRCTGQHFCETLHCGTQYEPTHTHTQTDLALDNYTLLHYYNQWLI